jgi:hypothetical protein
VVADDDSSGDVDGPPPGDIDASPRRRAFPLLLVAGLGAWKVYQAIAAETVRATVSPSLYVLGLAAFAVSLLGPRPLQLVTFFAGAVLCLAAIAVGAKL